MFMQIGEKIENGDFGKIGEIIAKGLKAAREAFEKEGKQIEISKQKTEQTLIESKKKLEVVESKRAGITTAS